MIGIGLQVEAWPKQRVVADVVEDGSVHAISSATEDREPERGEEWEGECRGYLTLKIVRNAEPLQPWIGRGHVDLRDIALPARRIEHAFGGRHPTGSGVQAWPIGCPPTRDGA